MRIRGKEIAMRTTVNLDEALLTQGPEALSGLQERSHLPARGPRRAHPAGARAPRLAKLGGSEPQLRDIPRRRETEK
jgi:hypothetical protein